MEFKEHEIIWTDEKVARLWDFYSRTFPYNELYFTKAVGKDVLKRTQKIVGKLTGLTILDFGCGPGFLVDHLISLNIKPKKYIGLDFSKKSIDALLTKRDRANFPIEGIFVSKLPSSLEKNTIDLCFLIEVIEHLNDEYLEKTLQEVYRVLIPEGKLIITTPNKEDLRLSMNFCPECGCIYHKWQHVRSLDRFNLEKVVEAYGFRRLKIVETNFLSRDNILKYFYHWLRYKLKGEKKQFVWGFCQKCRKAMRNGE